MQRGVAGRFEVVVTDDGSTDETLPMVREMAHNVHFPLSYTTHTHTTFQLSRCRNEGVAASRAPYLLYLDGDCLLPPDHVAIHLARRQPGVVWAGTFYRFDEPTSARVDDDAIRRGDFVRWADAKQIRRMRSKGRRSRFYELLRHPRKPRLSGNNVGIWRSDYLRINGYDENFQGWGWEDEDFGRRLRRAGLSIRSILRWTNTYHLWHPTDVTAPADEQHSRNAEYMRRKGALTRCRNGLLKRPLADLRLRIVGNSEERISRLTLPTVSNAAPDLDPEIEVVVLPGNGKFSGHAQCNVLVVADDDPGAVRLAKQAHVLVADNDLPAPQAFYKFRLHELPQALEAVA